MKIVFFSHDDELEEFLQDAVTSADVVMTDAEDDAMSEVEEALDEEIPVVLFLDFDGTRKIAEKLNKHYFKNGEVTRVVFTGEMSVKELKKHQDSKLGANAYMRKPLDAESISELLMDIEACDTAVFEYESSDDLFESVPAGNVDDSHDDEDDESDSSVNFSASELKMDTEVRYQLDRHNFNPNNAFNFSDETNLKVQAAFDLAFGANEAEHQDFPFDEEEVGTQQETNQSNEDQSIVFDFGSDEENSQAEISPGVAMGQEFDEDEETAETKLGENPRDILEQMESEREASLVGYRPPSLEETGDIEIPDEFRADSSEDGPQFDIPESDDSEEGGLDLGDGEGELEFGSDSEEEIQTAPESDDSEEGGLDLGDDGGALEFGSDADDEAQAVSADDDEEVGGLDLGDDGGELELGQDDSAGDDQLNAADEDDFGGLDLSDSDEDEDEDIGKTVVMNTEDVGLSFGMPNDADGESASEDSSSEIDFSAMESDSSLSEIDSEALSEGEEVNLDEALTGITEENLEEFDYTGSVTAEEDGEDGTLDEFADLGGMNEDDQETEATMVAGADFDVDAVMAEEELLDESDTLLSGMEEEESSEDDLLQSLETSESVAKPVRESRDSRDSRDPILVKTYNEEEMVRHQGLIRQLREEREDLLKQIQELKTNLRLGESENLGLRAELDELKIEKSIMKKRHQQELEEMRYALKLADEKRDIFEERARKVQKEFDKLNQKVRIDFNTVKQREKELEGQLELLKMDSQSQVDSRDKKILELKRKIDALEFNMENAHIKEQKSKEDKVKLEEKLHKVMKTLRSSIKVMEDDLEIDHLLSQTSDNDSENETSE